MKCNNCAKCGARRESNEDGVELEQAGFAQEEALGIQRNFPGFLLAAVRLPATGLQSKMQGKAM